MRRCRRAVTATMLALALCSVVGACGADPSGPGARAPGTTGTSRPRPAIATPVGEDPLPPALEERLQRVLDATRRGLPGGPGLLASVWVPGAGAWASISVEPDPAETEPLATNDHVRIGTVTTSMTVAVVLQLVDQGRLGLDDPISTWFPDLPDGGSITVRHLATMRSGIADSVNGAPVQRARAADRARVFSGDELTAGLQAPRTAAPGTTFARSDTNTVLLGQIVEKVTGLPLRTVLQDQLLGPLGMHHTALPEAADASLPRPFARGVTPDPAARTAGATVDATGWNPSWLSAAGAATSTVGDLTIWGYHLGSGRLLTPATSTAQRDFSGTLDSGLAYGMGLMRFPPLHTPGAAWLGFEGTIDGYATLVAFDPATEAVIVVVATTDAPVPAQDPGGSGAPRSATMLTFDALRTVLAADPPPTSIPSSGPSSGPGSVPARPVPGSTLPG